MKKKAFALLLFVYSFHICNGQTNIPAGDVSGIWTISGSPYNINGDITVPTGSTLTIQPGVIIEFSGPYRLTVSGTLNAIGTISQMIQFTKADTIGLYQKLTPAGGGTGRWNGIFFSFANVDTSRLDYCIIEYCNTFEDKGNPYFEQSAISCNYSTLIVSNCLIQNNYGVNAGGIKTDYGYIELLNNTISNNTGYSSAGGIWASTNQPKIIRGNTITNNIGISGGGINMSQCALNVIVEGNFISQNYANGGGGIMASTLASGQILQNIIVNNSAVYGGGIYFSSSGMVLLNNTICNNLATSSGGGISVSGLNYIDAENNIIWGNKVNSSDNNMDIGTGNCEPVFTTCLIGGGVSTISGSPANATLNNIITNSPFFVNPTSNAGKDYMSIPADWKLTVTSPCLNVGTETKFPDKLPALDFFKNPRKRFEHMDIGAHEFSQSLSSVIGTISTPTLWIADTIKITGNIIVNANLTIAPGVLVQFEGYFDMTINDTLIALGTVKNPIRFSINDTTGFSDKTNTSGRYKGLFTSGTSGIKFSNCIFNYAESLDFLNSSNLHFENNIVEKCLADNYLFEVTGESASIKNNIFRNNDNIQGSYYRLIFLQSLNCRFEGNRIYNNNTSALESYESNLQCVNNIIANNNGGALLIRSGYGNLFVNNTIVYNQGGIAVEQGTHKFYNNIIYKNPSVSEFYSLSYVDELLMSHNIFGSNMMPALWETFDGNIVIDPVFIKPVPTPGNSEAAEWANYGIFSISPAIDKGINAIANFTFPLVDVAGNSRNNNGSIDIGAFEDFHKIPELTVQPMSGSFCEGQNITLSVSPGTIDTMLYKWYKNGEIIPLEKSNTFTLSNITTNEIGSYSCQLSNAYGTIESFPASINIKTKPTILFSSDVQNLCENQDLTLEVSSVGQLPLTYTWQKNTVNLPSFITNRLKVPGATLADGGIYQAIVANQCGSDTSSNISVTVNPLPVVRLGNDTVICSNGNLVLDPGIYQSYLWNDFSSNRYKNIEATGDYSVRVTDQKGCTGNSDTVSMIVNLPYSEQKICMVTVDPETKKDMVIWEKVHNQGISSYNVYKLFGNNFVPIGNVLFDEIPLFIDYSSSPEAIAARYAVSVVDTCGNESEKSWYHQTMQLGASEGIQPNTVVLDWTNYIDESKIWEPAWYYIYRGTDPSKLVLLDSVSSVFTEWNDLDPANNRYYQVSCKKLKPCNPAELSGKKASSGPFLHSLSNLEDNRLQSTGINDLRSLNSLKIYPNPLKTESKIQWNNPKGLHYELFVYDLKGTLVRKISGLNTGDYTFHRENLAGGCYILELKGNKTYHGRIMIE